LVTGCGRPCWPRRSGQGRRSSHAALPVFASRCLPHQSVLSSQRPSLQLLPHPLQPAVYLCRVGAQLRCAPLVPLLLSVVAPRASRPHVCARRDHLQGCRDRRLVRSSHRQGCRVSLSVMAPRVSRPHVRARRGYRRSRRDLHLYFLSWRPQRVAYLWDFPQQMRGRAASG